MKEKIAEEIKCTAFFGTVYPDEIKRFDDTSFCTKDNLFQNRLSQIRFFVGEKNGKELILGLQTFYSNVNGKDIPNEEARDKSEKELETAMQSMGQNPTVEEIQEMMKEVDLDQDGKISFEEFMHLMTNNTKETETEDEVINAFRVFDKEGNGLISSAELKHIMMTIGDKMTEEEADEMVNEADIDEDGMINYEEFVRMMMAS